MQTLVYLFKLSIFSYMRKALVALVDVEKYRILSLLSRCLKFS